MDIIPFHLKKVQTPVVNITLQGIGEPKPLVTDEKKLIIHGTLKCDFAAIDDRRLYISDCIIHLCLDGVEFLGITYLMNEYMGCICCEDPKHLEYRESLHLNFVDRHKFWKPWISGQLTCSGLHTSTETKISGSNLNVSKPQTHLELEQMAFKPTYKIYGGKGQCVRIENRTRTRTNCRYCGLNYFHHIHNREIIQWTNSKNWNPMDLYCLMRCPIHLCVGCGGGFVKTTRAHLCAKCIVKLRLYPKKIPKPRWVLNESHNNYYDEIMQNVQMIYDWKSVQRRVKTKGGSTLVTETIKELNVPKSTQAVKEFLKRTELICGICHERFRLSLIMPAFLGSEPICGFCQVESS